MQINLKIKKGIKLGATSDAKVPVGFYVLEGPAEIAGDRLNIVSVPPRTRFPVKVTVVAWQYGNSNEPKLQTAVPVERTFLDSEITINQPNVLLFYNYADASFSR